MASTVGAKSSEGIIDVLAIVKRLRQKIRLIALIAFIVVGATAVYVFTVPPIYTARTRLVVDPNVRKPFDDSNAPSVLGNEALAVDTQLLIASSAAVLKPVVLEHGLTSDPEFVDIAGERSADELEAEAIKNLGKAVNVSREGATYVISVGVKSQGARKSADLSLAIANAYMREQRQFQLDHSQQLAEQIDGRLSGLRERLREADEKVQQFRASKRLQGSADGTLLVGQELSGLNAQLVEARAAFAGATAANAEIQRYLKREIDPTALGNITNSPRMVQLLEEYSRTVKEEASFSTTLLPQHPSVQRLTSQVGRLSDLIRDEVTAIGEGKKVELDVARQRVENIERQMDALRNSSNTGEQDMIELRELEAEAQSTRAVYENVLGRAKQVANLEQVTMPVARIISVAQPADAPSWPKKKILLGLAGILGLGLGVMVVIAQEVWGQVRNFMANADAVRRHEHDTELFEFSSSTIVGTQPPPLLSLFSDPQSSEGARRVR